MWNFSNASKNKLENLFNSKFKSKRATFQQEEWKILLKQLELNTSTGKVQHNAQYYNVEQINENMKMKYLDNTNAVARDIYVLYKSKLNDENDQRDINIKVQSIEDVGATSACTQTTESNKASNVDDRISSKDELCAFLNKSKNSAVDIFKYSVSDIIVLWDLFVSLEPDMALVKSFFEFILQPLLLSEETSRPLDLCLWKAYELFPDQMIDVIIMPTLQNCSTSYNTSLFIWVNYAGDKDKHRILNNFFDNVDLKANQIPILEKTIASTHMSDPLVAKLIRFIHTIKDNNISSIPAYGKFLGNIIKITRSRITAEEKDLLEEAVRSNTSPFKKFALNALGLK